MLGFILLLLVSTTNCDLILQALQSKEVFTSLLSSHLSSFHQSYPKSELRLRARLFRSSLQEIEDCNEHEQYSCGLNQFSTMTAEERQQYLGLDNSTHPNNGVEAPLTLSAPESKDWRTDGAVTGAKNQASCGSCWAFSAVGSLEGQYAITAGRLRAFSEQELLECSYEEIQPGHDGCRGGWYYHAFDYVKKYGHLSTEVNKPYRATDLYCQKNAPNGLVAAEVTGYVKVPPGDDALAGAIAITPVSVAMLSTGTFFSYSEGIYNGGRDCYAAFMPNHALTGVAYTISTFVIKNSWGDSWGDKGFINIARGYDVCRVSDFVYYPTMKKTGEDTKPTETPVCTDPEFDPNCKDENTRDCPGIAHYGDCTKDHMFDYAFRLCRKSCGYCNNIPMRDLISEGECKKRVAESGCLDGRTAIFCPKTCCTGGGGDDSDDGDNDGCPGGTTLCPDGTCKHVHMC